VREDIDRQEKELTELVDELNCRVSADDWETLHNLTERRKQLEEEILGLYSRLEELEDTKLD
jgi:hypothetical protein